MAKSCITHTNGTKEMKIFVNKADGSFLSLDLKINYMGMGRIKFIKSPLPDMGDLPV